MARDCHDGGQTQTVPRERSNTPHNNKLQSKAKNYKVSGQVNNQRCKVCLMSNHSTEYCRVLDIVKYLLKQSTADGARVHYMDLAMQDPWSEEMAPLRDVVSQDVDWAECRIEPEGLDDVITAALTCEDSWNWEEHSDSDID